MATTVRQQIIDAIVDRFATITSLGGRVSAWRIEGVRPDECPCLVVFDTVQEGSMEYSSNIEQTHALNISVVLFTLPTEQAIVTRSLMGDVLASIKSDPLFGLSGPIVSTEFQALSLTRDKFVDVASGGHLSLVINYTTPLWEV